MTKLIKSEKHVVVESFEGNLYFTTHENYVALKKALNENKFIELNGELLNVSTIKRVYISNGESTLNEKEKKALEQRKKEFKVNLGRHPNGGELKNIISKIIAKKST